MFHSATEETNARVLLCVATSTDEGGISILQICSLMRHAFEEDYTPKEVSESTDAMKHAGYVVVTQGTNLWTCTPEGKKQNDAHADSYSKFVRETISSEFSVTV